MDKKDQHQPARHILIDNSTLYNGLRGSIVCREDWKTESAGASYDLSKPSKRLRAMVTIGLEPGKTANDAELDHWRVRVADFLLTRLDDLNADILDVIFAHWIQRCSSPEQTVVIHANDFFAYRGLRPRAHSYWTTQKAEIAARIAMLSNTWVVLHDDPNATAKVKSAETKQRKLRSRAIVVSSVSEEQTGDEPPEYAWRVRPGDLFLPMLTNRAGKQLALMSQKILEYDFYRYSWEKRCARYFSWLHRIRQGRGEYLKGIRVGSVLAAIRKQVNVRDPVKTKDRLERALDRLCEDRIIRSWQYQDADESIIGRKLAGRRWHELWADWCLVIEPVAEVLAQYDKIKQLPQSTDSRIIDVAPAASVADIVQQMKDRRHERGLTQLQAAEQIGIAPNYLAMLERGVKDPSSKLRSVIAAWIKL